MSYRNGEVLTGIWDQNVKPKNGTLIFDNNSTFASFEGHFTYTKGIIRKWHHASKGRVCHFCDAMYDKGRRDIIHYVKNEESRGKNNALELPQRLFCVPTYWISYPVSSYFKSLIYVVLEVVNGARWSKSPKLSFLALK